MPRARRTQSKCSGETAPRRSCPQGAPIAGCPTPAAVQLVADRLTTKLSLTHTYASPGIYPIQMMLNDGGPGGFVTANATATVFGVKVDGPTNVNAGVAGNLYPHADGSEQFHARFGHAELRRRQRHGLDADELHCVFADVPDQDNASGERHELDRRQEHRDGIVGRLWRHGCR